MTVPASNQRRAYELHHIVSFAETNLVGNVYYTRHLEWQGRCREMFLHDHCADVLDELRNDLAMVTLRCSCEYLVELQAFDRIVLRMRLADLTQSRITLAFDYMKQADDGSETLAARGEQQIATMRRNGGELLLTPIPVSLKSALGAYC